MKKVKAKKYPLLKEFDFALYMGGLRGGQGILLIPKKDIYVPKIYGFGELHLIPYLQEPFNDGLEISIQDLKQNLEEEQEIFFIDDKLRKVLGDKEPFLNKVLRKLYMHQIIKHKKIKGKDDEFNLEDIIHKGSNYDKIRVYEMKCFEGNSEFF